MKKYITYFNEKIIEPIKLNKIGITIKKISLDDVNIIVENLSKIFLDKKIMDFVKIYMKNKEITPSITEKEKFLELFFRLNKSEQEIVGMEAVLIKENNEINRDYFRNIVKQLVVIEIDERVFNELFANDTEREIIQCILNFSSYIGNEEIEEKYDVSIIEFYELEKKDNYILYYVLLSLLKTKFKANYKILKQMQELFNKSNKIFNFNFISIINLLLNNNYVIENIIVNKVSIIERILIGKNDEKQKMFVLKTGIVCSSFIEEESKVKISKVLNTIYETRSLIVHGEDYKIVEEINKYKCIFGEDIKIFKNKWETKRNILECVDLWLTFFLKEVLKKYLEEPNFIEYIKEN